MPAEIARKERRAQRRATDDKTEAKIRDLEQKRNRGEVSCAECRRLKLKCDRNVPCASCVRRGCPTICPNGVLSAGQGTRYVLADTKRMHHKMIDMSDRIRQLEDALDVATRGISNVPHPLLTEEHLKIKQGIDAFDESEDSDPAEDKGVCLNDFGTLTISDHGETRFLGRSGGLEALLGCNDVHGEQNSAEPWPEDMQLSPLLANALASWPFTPANLPKEQLMHMILDQLPPQDRAYTLADAFIHNLSWHLSSIDRNQIFEELLPEFYKDGHIIIRTPTDEHRFGHCPQDTSLLFMVLALGACADLEQAPMNNESEYYHQLSRVALAINPIFEHPTVATVQCLCLMGVYYIVSGRRRTMETPWFHNNVAFNLALSIGLHRDPARWDLPPKIARRRRMVFWEMFNVDSWQSLASGRPTLFSLRSVDCAFPDDLFQEIDDEGKPIPSLSTWKYRFAKEILYPVSYVTSSAQPLKYSEILDLDRKVREFENPPKPPKGMHFGKAGPVLFVQHLMVTSFRDIVLLYIHRNFFARAVSDNPSNPFSSQYAPSFLAAYRSSTVLIRMMSEHYQWFPSLLARFWIIWAHVLSATVMVGSIVAKGPASSLAPAAFMELDLAVGLFEKAGTVVPFARHALPILVKLRAKAHAAYQAARDNPTENGVKKTATDEVRVDHKDDELAIIGGATRLFENKSPTQRTSFSTGSPSIPCPTSTTGTCPPTNGNMSNGALHGSMTNSSSMVDGAMVNGSMANGSMTNSSMSHSSNSSPRDVAPSPEVFPPIASGSASRPLPPLPPSDREAIMIALLRESLVNKAAAAASDDTPMMASPSSSSQSSWKNMFSSDPTALSPFTDLNAFNELAKNGGAVNALANAPNFLQAAPPLPLDYLNITENLPSYNIPPAASMMMPSPGKYAMPEMSTPERNGEEVSMDEILPGVGSGSDNSWMWFLQEGNSPEQQQQQQQQNLNFNMGVFP